MITCDASVNASIAVDGIPTGVGRIRLFATRNT